MLLLGIETSCDDTAVAIVRDGRDVLANVSTNQDEFHRAYGGIVPEIASRAHLALLSAAVEHTLDRARIGLDACDGIAVTYGPGLIGSLLVGVATAKAFAYAARRPLYAVNHLHGHLFAPFLSHGESPPYPFLALLVSGGHTQLVAVDAPTHLRILGKTRDDAAGEAFDKVARLLGLGYPGGPAIQKAAEDGDPDAFKLPRAWLRGTYDYSFSGLKTAALHLVQSFNGKPLPVADIAASFQAAITDVLVEKTKQAASEFGAKQILLAGGVAANKRLREQMVKRADRPVLIPPPKLCIDNGAMIASAAWWHLEKGERSGWELDVLPSLQLAVKGQA